MAREFRSNPVRTQVSLLPRPEISPAVVLIADDSEADRIFLMRAFSSAAAPNPVRMAESGEEVIRYLSGAGEFADRAAYPLPNIIFLDLKMPPPSGLDVLVWKQTQPKLPRMLWVAVSAVTSIKAIDQAYKAGADTFLAKPLHPDDVKNLLDSFNEFWAIQRAIEMRATKG